MMPFIKIRSKQNFWVIFAWWIFLLVGVCRRHLANFLLSVFGSSHFVQGYVPSLFGVYVPCMDVVELMSFKKLFADREKNMQGH